MTCRRKFDNLVKTHVLDFYEVCHGVVAVSKITVVLQARSEN